MSDHWTLPLSEEGTKEILEERATRPAESEQRLRMLERVLQAVRSIRHGDTGRQLQQR
jgi:hypothetical protein